jgi:hypothetical protein
MAHSICIVLGSLLTFAPEVSLPTQPFSWIGYKLVRSDFVVFVIFLNTVGLDVEIVKIVLFRVTVMYYSVQ